jgi:adiponectin receptor
MFVLMGLSAVFPVVHGVFLFGIQQMKKQMGLYWVIAQGALYIAGAGLYAVGLMCSGPRRGSL